MQTAVSAGLVLVGAGVLYLVIFRDEAAAPAAPPPAPIDEPLPALLPSASSEPPTAPAPAFEITEVDGTVEVRRGGVWTPVRTGDSLAEAEAIRTGGDSRATLRSGQGDELTLRPRVELEVGLLGRTVTELTLTRGKVRAAPGAGSDRFQIKSGGASATARAGARFTVYADARGAVTVATEDGEVKVLAQGREVTLQKREQTHVEPGAPPHAPNAIPDVVFVSVAWPSGELHAKSTVIRGRAHPGTEVTVNGQEAAVASDGSFEARVPLETGANTVKIVAEGMDGSRAEKSGSIQADTRGPPLEADPNRLYDRK